MTKNEYQTDIHELIQKRPPPTRKLVDREINLAFDKCTLLSSQRSDAPASRESQTRCPGWATSLSYLAVATPSNRPASFQRVPHESDERKTRERILVVGGGSLLEGSQAFRPSALPFGANKEYFTCDPRSRRIHPASRACRAGSSAESRGSPGSSADGRASRCGGEAPAHLDGAAEHDGGGAPHRARGRKHAVGQVGRRELGVEAAVHGQPPHP